MNRSKPLVLGIVGIALVILLGLGLVFGHRFLIASTPKNTHVSFQANKSSGTSSIEVAEKSVSLLEEKETAEAMKAAQEAVQSLSEGKAKDNLVARISVVQAKLKNKELLAEAERAVKYLEDHQDISNISLAQEKVAQVTDPLSKRALENRIRLVQEAIDHRGQLQAEPNKISSADSGLNISSNESFVPEVVPESSPSAELPSSGTISSEDTLISGSLDSTGEPSSEISDD